LSLRILQGKTGQRSGLPADDWKSVMRFVIFLAGLSAMIVFGIVWYSYGLAEIRQFNLSQDIEMAIIAGPALFFAVTTLLLIAYCVRQMRKMARLTQGVDRMERDIARRLSALEMAVRENRERATRFELAVQPDLKPAPAKTPMTGQGGQIGGTGANPVRSIDNFNIGTIHNSHNADEIGQAIAQNRIAIWFQPVVALPERISRFLVAVPYLIPVDDQPARNINCDTQLADNNSLAAITRQMADQCIYLARQIRLAGNDCRVILPVPAKAVRSITGQSVLKNLLLSDSTVFDRIVIELDQPAFNNPGATGARFLSECSSAGFGLGVFSGSTLALTQSRIDKGVFQLVRADARTLLNAGTDSDTTRLGLLRKLKKNAKLQIIATGIETDETVMELIDQDILLAQGPFFSAPRPLRDTSQSMGMHEQTGMPAF
jgi:EAL domain-containing protein (putative c-di-GMP-specific phosphodiesterase class I)